MPSIDRPIVLAVCDGWGHAPPSPGNAIALARKPVFDRWMAEFPKTLLSASGEDVGLPAGLMGNSEVGHLTLGAGRMVPQDLLRIDLALRDGTFFDNPVLIGAVRRAARAGTSLHLLGLLSDGGVHSHERHLHGLLELAARHGAPRVRVHVFTDGRDTPPQSALVYLDRLESALARHGGRISTVSGRYFAMDRDARWDRVEKAFVAIARGQAPSAASAREAVEAAYARGETDEFIRPTLVAGPEASGIAQGDTGIFFNFRADRARQLARALALPGLAEFARGEPPPLPDLVCFTEYKKEYGLPVAFQSRPPERILAQAWAEAGASNLRLAETEKYAHVTYFFNGGVERAYPGEERRLIPSWRGATYDLHPQMCAEQITVEAESAIAANRHAVLVINFANADMVGHTGKIPETVRAIEVLDACLGRLEEAARRASGLLLMTADHGNAEQMIDPVTGAPHTAHTTNPVPFVLCRDDAGLRLRSSGTLADVAPTVLGLQGIPVPKEMTGRDLRETGDGRR